jgi:DNA repair exonuclease SbcCD ATPase subunit
VTRPHPRAAGLALVLCVATCQPALAQDGDDAFKGGIEARKRNQHGEVVTQMRRAINADGKESSRKVGRTLIFGGTEYLPYFFLGEAYYKQGDCPNAVVAWTASDKQEVVRGHREHVAFMRQGLSACEAKGVLLAAKYDPLAARSTQQLTELATRFQRIRELGEQHAEIWRGNSSFGEQYDKARAEDKAARTHLNAAERTRLEREFTEVAQAAERANAVLTALENDVRAAVQGRERLTGVAADIRRLIDEGRRLDGEIESMKQHLSPALSATRADGMKALARAGDLLAGRSQTEASIAGARTAANEGLEQLRSVQRAVGDAAANLARQAMGSAVSRARELFQVVDGQFTSLDVLLTSKRIQGNVDVSGRRDAARKKFESARRRLGAAQRDGKPAEVDASTRIADQVRLELEELTQAFGELTLVDRGVPEWLQRGADQYFKGEYREALDSLDDGQAPNQTAQAHAHMLRAAAHHALWVRSGERDRAQVDQAVAEIGRCKAIVPDFAPDTGWFSPRFLELFRQGGNAAR